MTRVLVFVGLFSVATIVAAAQAPATPPAPAPAPAPQAAPAAPPAAAPAAPRPDAAALENRIKQLEAQLKQSQAPKPPEPLAIMKTTFDAAQKTTETSFGRDCKAQGGQVVALVAYGSSQNVIMCQRLFR